MTDEHQDELTSDLGVDTSADIAIVGMAGHLPKSPDLRAFWRNLRDGVECIRHWTEDELREAGVSEELLADPNYVRSWGYLAGGDLFDAAFFDVNPREAEITDPQIRLMLETSWEALEDAGHDPGRYRGRIGVFAGSSNHTYVWTNLLADDEVLETMGMINTAIVNDKDFLATRVSYKLDLKGPSMTVQTACSTSLVAVHLACQSLLAGESDMVLAGGVSAPCNYLGGYMYNEGGTFSPDGHVRAFDARGKGMLGGNGIALVVLKRLEDALADGDCIRAVIKGSALNNDGTHKVSFTAPSVDGQSQVVVDALEVAGIDPATISYVECHGTGTPLGDPIEIAALTQAWRRYTDEKGWCPIGSVKTNIGHLDTAAGVSGLVKVTLALQHKQIPPSLNFEQPNPEIDFENSPFFVNTELCAWDTERLPRRAAVSALGMGGTNAHAVLEEAPEVAPSSASRAQQLFLLSARSEDALDQAASDLAERLEEEPGLNLADAAYTLMVGRAGFRQRRAVVAADREALLEALRRGDARRVVDGHTTPHEPRVALLFSGQGAQHANMTRDLYEREPLYRAEVDRCCELLRAPLGRDLRELLFPAPGAEEAAGEELRQTRFTQPALFVVEYALARLWSAWGIEPDAMLGHSIGEYVAATLAGVFELGAALELVATRGHLIDDLPAGGAMLSVQLPEAELRAHVGKREAADGGGLDIAAINAPGLCVVSGPEAELALLEQRLEPAGVATRRLVTSHAFHSRLMEPMLAAFEEAVERAAPRAPERTVISCSTGRVLTAEEAQDPRYWVRHVRESVRFADGIHTLAAEPGRVFLEVGPGDTLASLTGLNLMEAGLEAVVVASARHPKEHADDQAVLLRALGALWCAGAAPDWERFHADERRLRVPLPTYPFERQSYWIEPSGVTPAAALQKGRPAAAQVAAKYPDPADWFHVPSWQLSLAPLGGSPEHALPDGKRACRLVFVAAGEPGDALLAELADDLTLVRVAAAGAFEERGEDYALAPGEPDGYGRLLDALDARGLFPCEVVHLWNAEPGPAPTLAALEADQDQGFWSLLFLGQALARYQGVGRVRLAVVTSGMQRVLGAGPRVPERATVIGPVKSLGAELSGVVARSLDLADEDDASRAALAHELACASEDPLVAFAAGRRWLPCHEPLRLEEGDTAALPRLREGGTFLVTGGLGGVGLTFARFLAERRGARLVLTARTALPDRAAWGAWLAEHDPEDRTARKIARVQELEELGAEVLVLAADSADLDAMRAVVAAARERFGKLDGAIHAAGVAGTSLLELQTRDQAQEVLAPKVRGTRVLLEALGEEPEVVVLCSSISSALSAWGQVDYFAANAYLDACAQAHAGARPHVVAVNWDAWQEVGMAVETDVPEGMKAARAAAVAQGLAPREACEALRRVLGTDLPQVFVSARELTLREDYLHRPPVHGRVEAAAAPEPEAREAPRKKRTARPRPSLSVDFEAPRGTTEGAIAEIWADLLGLEGVGRHDNFFELGGNSLVMMQINVRLRGLYGLSLPIRELFDLPEVSLLADRVDAIAAVSGDATSDEGAEEEFEEFTL